MSIDRCHQSSRAGEADPLSSRASEASRGICTSAFPHSRVPTFLFSRHRRVRSAFRRWLGIRSRPATASAPRAPSTHRRRRRAVEPRALVVRLEHDPARQAPVEPDPRGARRRGCVAGSAIQRERIRIRRQHPVARHELQRAEPLVLPPSSGWFGVTPVNDSRSPVSTQLPRDLPRIGRQRSQRTWRARTCCVDRTYSASTPTGPAYR